MDKGEYAHRVNFLHSVGRSQESLPYRHGGCCVALEDMAAECRELVQNEHATVSQRYLARYRHVAATDQPRIRDGGDAECDTGGS